MFHEACALVFLPIHKESFLGATRQMSVPNLIQLWEAHKTRVKKEQVCWMGPHPRHKGNALAGAREEPRLPSRDHVHS